MSLKTFRLSYDTQGTIDEALKIIDVYKHRGITKDRILIKIAATWEGMSTLTSDILYRHPGCKDFGERP